MTENLDFTARLEMSDTVSWHLLDRLLIAETAAIPPSLHPPDSRRRWRRQIRSHRRLPYERDLLARQKAEVGSPLVLEMERPMAVAFPLAPNRMPKEPLVLADVPALLPTASRPIHDLLNLCRLPS